MKKLLIALFVLGIALPSFAGIKEKHVIGSWSYSVEADQQTLTGTVVFEKKDGELAGKVKTSDGQSFAMTKIEIRDNNVLYFELQPDYEVFKISVTIDGKKFSGTVNVSDGSAPITGEKLK